MILLLIKNIIISILKREWNDVKLTSILNLREIIEKNDNKGKFFFNFIIIIIIIFVIIVFNL